LLKTKKNVGRVVGLELEEGSHGRCVY